MFTEITATRHQCPNLSTPCLQGHRAQNRAVEGDEVIIRILPPDQWYQMASKQQQAQQGPQQATQLQGREQTPGVEATAAAGVAESALPTPAAAVRGNVVPGAGLASKAAAAVDAAQASEELAAADMTPPALAGAPSGHQHALRTPWSMCGIRRCLGPPALLIPCTLPASPVL